ncbi:MAG: hypothetical protein QXW74_03965 [Archaeoglobaceae archaeon]
MKHSGVEIILKVAIASNVAPKDEKKFAPFADVIEIKSKAKLSEHYRILAEVLSRAYFESELETSEDSIQLLEEIESKMLSKIDSSSQYRLSLESLMSACRHMKSIGEIALNKSVRESLKATR